MVLPNSAQVVLLLGNLPSPLGQLWAPMMPWALPTTAWPQGSIPVCQSKHLKVRELDFVGLVLPTQHSKPASKRLYYVITYVTSAFAFEGCHNKIPQTWWPKQQSQFIVSRFWRSQVWNKSVSRVDAFWELWGKNPLQVSLLVLWMDNISISVCLRISSFHKDTSRAGLGPTPMTSSIETLSTNKVTTWDKGS